MRESVSFSNALLCVFRWLECLRSLMSLLIELTRSFRRNGSVGWLVTGLGWMKGGIFTGDVVVHACLQAALPVANHCRRSV